MGIDWWRSWHGAPMDHKWSVIAARAGVKTGVVSAVAWALMDYASQQDDRGSVAGFDTETYAVYSGFSLDEVEAIIQAMRDKRFIVDEHLANWEKRQPKREDNSTPRVTKFREMKRNVTHGNAPEKEKEEDKDSDTDTELDTEKDKDTDTEREAETPLWSSAYALYESNIGLLSSTISDKITDALETYPAGWVEEAIQISTTREKRSWSYVEGILRNWKRDGKDNGQKPNGSAKKIVSVDRFADGRVLNHYADGTEEYVCQ